MIFGQSDPFGERFPNSHHGHFGHFEKVANMETWFNANFAEVTPVTSGGAQPEQGVYTVTIGDIELRPSKNNAQLKRAMIRFDVQGFKGVIWLNNPYEGNSADKNSFYLRMWRSCLEACGYTADQLNSGEVQIGPDTIKGKSAQVYFIPSDGDEYPDIRFVTPDQASAIDSGSLIIGRKGGAKPVALGAVGGLGSALGAAPSTLGSSAGFSVQTAPASTANGSALSSLLGSN